MPRRLWCLVLGFSLVLHLLVVSLMPPMLPRMPGVEPMQRKVRVSFPKPQPEPAPEERKPPEPSPEPEPEPEKEPEEPHMPRDTDEVTDLDGTSMDAPEAEEAPAAAPTNPQAPGEEPSPETSQKPSRPESREKPPGEGAEDETEPESGAPSPDAATEGDTRSAPEPASASMSLGEAMPEPDTAPESSPGPGLGSDSGMQALDEGEMDAIRGESMVSEIEERRIRMANEYLARMKRQIMARWEQPEGADERHRGEIRFSVDVRGYLQTSRVHLPSGYSALDESVLRAVRSVQRYRVPDSPSIVRRYYQNLRFTYSGESVSNDD